MEEHEIKSLLPFWLIHSKTYSLVITDLEGKYIFTNDVFKNRFSFLTDEFTKTPFSETIHPDDIEKCNLAAERCIINPDEVVDVKLRKPDNLKDDFYWTHWEFSLFKDKNNEPIGILCIGHDITESMRTAQLAIEFTEKTEKVIENITDGFYVLDKKWRFIKTNQVAENIFGLNQEKLIGEVIWDIFPEDINSSYAQQFRKSIEENITVNFEYFNEHHQQWFKFTAYPSPEGLTVFFRDVTFEHHTQKKLENSENKLRAILDSSTDSNILISPDFRVLSANQVAKRITKNIFEKEIKEGDDFWQYVVKKSEKEFRINFNKALDGEHIKLEKEILFENGLSIWFEVSYTPVYDQDKNILGISFNGTNIEQRKKAEQKLKESEYMLSAIYNSTSEASSFISIDFKMLYFNKVASDIIQRIFQKKPQIGDNYFDYILPEFQDEFRKNFKKVRQGKRVSEEKKSEDRWYRFSLFPIYDEQNKLVGIADTVQDITEKKLHELHIAEQNKRLAAIAWEQAHEVRRHVANILGLIKVIHLADSKEELNQYLSLLAQTAGELDQITHRIVKYTEEIKP